MRLSEELRGRTNQYASAIIRCYVKLPKEREEVRVRTVIRKGDLTQRREVARTQGAVTCGR